MIVRKINEQSLEVKFNYSPDYVDRIKTVTGAFFNSQNKTWVIPMASFKQFDETFKGEVIYTTPKWEITGDSPPDYSKFYHIDERIKTPVMKLKPFPYQDYGIRFMISHLENSKFVFNCDGVGLGKTIQAIGVIKYMIENAGYNRILVICKKSLKAQWVSEFEKFTDLPSKMKIAYNESAKNKRTKLFDELDKEKQFILVTNYHTVMNDYDRIAKMGFDSVCIDEVHTVKARTGVINKAISKVCKNAKKVIFLTGTPIQNKAEDLFGIVQIADKKFFGTWESFKARYIREENKGRYKQIIGYTHLDELREKILGVIIRRTEKEVELELPEQLPAKVITIQKDSLQKKIENKILDDRTKVMQKLDQMEPYKNSPKVIEKYQMLDGFCKGLAACLQANVDDPRLFNMSKSKVIKKLYAPLIPNNYSISPKMEALIETVDEIHQAGEKVLIFSSFERCCQLIKQDLYNKLGIDALLYTGAIDDEMREKNIAIFKTDPDHDVLILTSAGSEGLNLQNARHQINYDQPFSPAEKIQRAGRVRRIGSRYKTTCIYDLIVADSRDSQRLEDLEKAEKLSDSIIGINKAQSEALKNEIRRVE